MLPIILAIFYIASTTAYTVLDDSYIVVESDPNELQWPESYSVKATRVALMSRLVEDYTAWKTNLSSRVDYNEGAVKRIAKMPENDDDDWHLKYEIHPVTTESYLNRIECHYALPVQYLNYTSLDRILPDVVNYDYEVAGNDSIDGMDVTVFKSIEILKNKEERRTLYAAYSDEIGWFPVKYDYAKYDGARGAMVEHDIWTFSDFKAGEIDEEIFDTEKYGCDKPNAIKHTPKSEKVVKELMFIDTDDEEHVDHIFDHFKSKFGRNYAHEDEHEYRRDIFKQNMRLISAVNKRNLKFKLGVNQFSDQTLEERQRSFGILPLKKGLEAPPSFNSIKFAFLYDEEKLQHEVNNLPEEYDMREYGFISPVKNQEDCGSCWTFAAAAVVESALARINGHRVLGLSNQAIVDCAYEGLVEEGGGGCNGGFDYAAYNFIAKHGLPTEQEYGPYKNKDGYCNIGNMTKTYPITGYTAVTKYSANAMKVAVVNHGPLYIYVHVSMMFSAYSSGIYYEPQISCDPEEPNHAVTLVGYGVEDGEEFFILKNSYGDYWGEDGYMRISARDNVCGVASNPTYPVFK